MDFDNKNTSAGSLKISHDVIASIAKFAAIEIEGVEAVSTGNIGVRGFMTKTNYIRPIKIEMSEDVVNVEISIIVQSGTHIPNISAAIQRNVKNEIQSMTGLAVAKVDVVIAGVEMHAPASDPVQVDEE